MNSGLIQVLRRPGAGAAQPCITCPKARSTVMLNTPFWMTRARLRETWKPSSSKMARGSGDHHVMGSTVQGKMPLR